MNKIFIIGGGPCGIMSAYTIKKNYPDYEVTILEKDNEIGKRIKVSGNGRCNFSNANASEKYYQNGILIQDIINSYKKIEKDFYHDINLHYYVDEEGRMYPVTNSSKTVHSLLLEALKRLNVKIITSCNVSKIIDNGKIEIYSNLGTFSCDKLIIANGGLSYLYTPEKNKLYENLGISLTKCHPSLCPIQIMEKLPKDIVGKRAKANVKLSLNDRIVFEEKGEILFKKDGISGIVIFNVSSYIAEHYQYLKQYKIHFDFIDNITEEEINEEIKKYGKVQTVKSYLVDEIGVYILSLNKNIYKCLKDLTFSVNNLYDYKESQVTSGGIDLNEIDLNDLSLKKHKNIYVGGECINVDGKCGGYNIFFAFASGNYIGNKV